jgi:uncharacterized protein YdaU (DUF1376 family)
MPARVSILAPAPTPSTIDGEMESALNYYRRWMGDYMRDTADLSLAEHGAYTMLLDHYYSTEKPLPADIMALCRLCRAMTPEEQLAVRKVAEKFFPERPDGLRHNQRADEEIGSAQAVIDGQRKSGAAAARRRWGPKDDPEGGGGPGSEDGSTHDEPDGSTDGSTHTGGNGSTGGSAIQPPTSNLHTPTTNHQPPTAMVGASPLPAWVPEDAWVGWLEMRKKRKAPPTERALTLAVQKLEELRNQGHDPAKVLDQSTTCGWTGLFPLKDGNRLSAAGQSTVVALRGFVKKGGGNA